MGHWIKNDFEKSSFSYKVWKAQKKPKGLVFSVFYQNAIFPRWVASLPMASTQYLASFIIWLYLPRPFINSESGGASETYWFLVWINI